jgi:hypothetical protein
VLVRIEEESGEVCTMPVPTPEQLAGNLIGAIIHSHRGEIDPAKLSWLKAFLRARVSRGQYRLIAHVMGWPRRRGPIQLELHIKQEQP